MPKYWIHVPVSGALDVVVEADSAEEVFDNYLKRREEYMKFHNSQLMDSVEDIQIIKVSDPTIC